MCSHMSYITKPLSDKCNHPALGTNSVHGNRHYLDKIVFTSQQQRVTCSRPVAAKCYISDSRWARLNFTDSTFAASSRSTI